MRGWLHEPDGTPTAALALTHGAGANCRTALLTAAAAEFAARGWLVLRFDLPFRQKRPGGPPRPAEAPESRAGIQAAIGVVRGLAPDVPLFFGGHSYGGRQSSMLAAESQTGAAAMLLLSYPLHPPQKPDNLRTAHFPNLKVPAFFVHGTKDPFGTTGELAAALALVPARTQLFPVDGAGHDLGGGKKLAFCEAFLEFARTISPDQPTSA